MKDNSPKFFYYVWNYVEWGGAQVLFFGLMKEAKKNGKVIAVLPKDSNGQLLNFLDNLGVKYQFVDSQTDGQPAVTLRRKFERHRNKLTSEFVYFRYLSKLDLKNSVLHTEFAPWHSFLVLWLLALKTQVFVTIHNSLPPVPKWRFWLWKAKFWLLTRQKNFHIFTANKDAKQNLQALVPSDAFDKIVVTYANVNPSEIEEAVNCNINRDELCEKYGIPNNKFLVFCVGQFIDRKGRWIFLEAAKSLTANNKDIAFVWISNSKPTGEELKKAESYGLEDNFRLIISDQIGTEHIELFKLMRLADVFALPSFVEGLPISIVEAMALGIPTISTNINAIPEAVKHLKTGWLIEPGSSSELTAAIQTLKDDPKLRNIIAAQGRDFVLREFTEKVVACIAVENYLEAFRAK